MFLFFLAIAGLYLTILTFLLQTWKLIVFSSEFWVHIPQFWPFSVFLFPSQNKCLNLHINLHFPFFIIPWLKQVSIVTKTGCLTVNVKKVGNDSGQWACSGKLCWKKLLLNSLLKCYSTQPLALSSHLVSLPLGSLCIQNEVQFAA